jgi:MFS transporter, DHA1 family, tetracycline resistance protein
MSFSAARDEPRRGSLLVIFLTVFIDLLGFGMVLPLLPIYADVFTVDPAGWRLGLLMASFSIMQLLFAPFWGRLSDRIGRRPVLIIGLAGSVVFYLLFGIATVLRHWELLLAARIGAGIAGATIPTAQAYIADTTSLEKRSKGMALIGMAFGLGFTFGPLVGFLAVPGGKGEPGPWPGYAAAILSGFALLLAIWKLPESLRPGSRKAAVGIARWREFRQAVSVPSVALLLTAIFVGIFSFANFETTLSMLIKGRAEADSGPFRFTWGQVCLTYAYIGFTMTVVQGILVRRLAGRVSEGRLAASGALLQVIGFVTAIASIYQTSPPLLMAALAVITAGAGLMQPSLNSLLSRRSDPERQGVILGVGQSVNAMARILGAGLGIPMLRFALTLPYLICMALMILGLLLVVTAARKGRDHVAGGTEHPAQP